MLVIFQNQIEVTLAVDGSIQTVSTACPIWPNRTA